MLIDYLLIVPQLNNRHLIVQFYTLVWPPADWISFQIKLVLGFVRNLNPLTCHMFIAKPFSSVIAEVDIISKDVKSIA